MLVADFGELNVIFRKNQSLIHSPEMKYMSKITSLKEYEWKRTYKSIHRNLVREFLIPALERSILYKRVAGYFSSSVLVAAAGGIARLLKNEGEMQLIVGADLSHRDVEALNKDPEKLMEIIQNKIPDNLNELNDLGI